MRPPPDWHQVIEETVRSPGTVMVLGEGDVGKTTFCLSLANAGAERGLKVGVVDADVGQSHIGPPAAIGLGVVDKPVSNLGEVQAEALYFIGSHSPAGHFSRMAVGTAKMVARAKGKRLPLIVVDCGGMAMGKFAWRLARGEVEMVHPQHLVLLKRGRGLEALAQMCREWRDLTCHQLQMPPGIRRKSAARRKKFREKAWENHLREASRLKLPLGSVALEGVPASETEKDWTGWIVGLHDVAGECLGLGLVVRLDWPASRLEVQTPVGEGREVGVVVFGSQKVRVSLD